MKYFQNDYRIRQASVREVSLMFLEVKIDRYFADAFIHIGTDLGFGNQTWLYQTSVSRISTAPPRMLFHWHFLACDM